MRLGGVLAGLIALFAAGCGPSGPTLVVYASLEPELAKAMAAAFAEGHPGVSMKVIEVPHDQIIDRLSAERDAPGGALVWGVPAWLLHRAALDGLLAPTPLSWSGSLPREARDPQDRWVGVLVDPVVLAFHPDHVSRSRAPRDWIDLFHPRWRGEVVVVDPEISPTLTSLIGLKAVQALRAGADETVGFDWLMRLDASVDEYSTDIPWTLRRLSVGEHLFAAAPLSGVDDMPGDMGLEHRYFESGSPSLVIGAGRIVGAASSPQAAEFLEWLGSDEAATAMAEDHHRIAAVTLWGPGVETGLLDRIDPLLAPPDTMDTHLDGWVRRWRSEVRGHGNTLY
ncbi:MAG: ABC transporter substrate-binding protein [Gemmatimonadota bacterium]|nr:ABC transporter substrate-binding protein [Gemmatimonadota bacterium]